MRVLVTGGAGFIGANLVRLLLEHSYQVTVLDNLSTGRWEYLKGLPIEFTKGDIRNADLANQEVSGHDGVVHLAAQTGVPASLVAPRIGCEVNVIGTLNMLQASQLAGVERFVFASSNAPLGRQPPPATEGKAPLPISPYGASKLAGEGYCLAYHGSWGLGTIVLRFSNIYGPYSAHKSSVIPQFFKDILAKDHITIDGDGQQTRDFLYVGDLCHAILLSLESNVGGEVFQVATGVETSIIELANMIQRIVGRDVEMECGLPRRGDIRRNYSAIAKVRQMLNWNPRVGLSQGLRETYGWFRDR